MRQYSLLISDLVLLPNCSSCEKSRKAERHKIGKSIRRIVETPSVLLDIERPRHLASRIATDSSEVPALPNCQSFAGCASRRKWLASNRKRENSASTVLSLRGSEISLHARMGCGRQWHRFPPLRLLEAWSIPSSCAKIREVPNFA